MPPKKQAPRRRSNNVARQITARLRRAHLTGPPTWYKTHNRHLSPPEIPNSPPYFVKVRIILSTIIGDVVTITPIQITESYTVLFSHVSVQRIDAWAPSGDYTISCTPYRQIGNDITTDRTFFGTGVSGSLRSYVTVSISPKDVIAQFVGADSKPIVAFQVFDETGASVESSITVDLWCTFTSLTPQISKRANFIRLTADSASQVSASKSSDSFMKLSLDDYKPLELP